jgi:hypothetical protein
MKATKPNSRRNFLLAAGLGTAGAAAAVATARKVTSDGSTAPAVDQPKGYHVSEHILKYYKTTEA